MTTPGDFRLDSLKALGFGPEEIEALASSISSTQNKLDAAGVRTKAKSDLAEAVAARQALEVQLKALQSQLDEAAAAEQEASKALEDAPPMDDMEMAEGETGTEDEAAEGEDSGPLVADMAVSEFLDMLTNTIKTAVSSVIADVTTKMGELDSALKTYGYTRGKEAAAAAETEQTATKALTTAEQALAGIHALLEGQPRAVARATGIRPTESGVVVKEAGETSTAGDTLTDFVSLVMGEAASTAPSVQPVVKK